MIIKSSRQIYIEIILFWYFLRFIFFIIMSFLDHLKNLIVILFSFGWYFKIILNWFNNKIDFLWWIHCWMILGFFVNLILFFSWEFFICNFFMISICFKDWNWVFSIKQQRLIMWFDSHIIFGTCKHFFEYIKIWTLMNDLLNLFVIKIHFLRFLRLLNHFFCFLS